MEDYDDSAGCCHFILGLLISFAIWNGSNCVCVCVSGLAEDVGDLFMCHNLQ